MSDPKQTWMIRSPSGTQAEDWEQQGIVAIGYDGVGGDLSAFTDWEKTVVHLLEASQGTRLSKVQLWQVARFRTEPQSGDRVISYDSGRREYLYGTIGPYRFELREEDDKPHIRSASWEGRISRDDLSQQAKNVLGSSLTIFSPKQSVADEIERLIRGEPRRHAPTGSSPYRDGSTTENDVEDDPIAFSVGTFDELADVAMEQIKDRVMCLDDSEMEHLVAGILRAMGYKTRVSRTGSDRGRDVIASPDGLGFEHPRIIVEVKHRNNAISAPTIRGLAGALTPTDRGLFVSTGGFTKDARYEADRANPPITLLDSDELVQLLVDNYTQTDSPTKTLVPLKPLYWPA